MQRDEVSLKFHGLPHKMSRHLVPIGNACDVTVGAAHGIEESNGRNAEFVEAWLSKCDLWIDHDIWRHRLPRIPNRSKPARSVHDVMLERSLKNCGHCPIAISEVKEPRIAGLVECLNEDPAAVGLEKKLCGERVRVLKKFARTIGHHSNGLAMQAILGKRVYEVSFN